ncbi:MAG: glycosyltransferase [Gracilimonas sp.]|uniref:glycosyltransferase n=1 Tax=Gracilimonas sp. TaxID=1974203 RepID=UPI00374FEF64|nr:glycosyltransferase [Gracilimonas sp.]
MQKKPERRKIALFSTSFLPYSQTFIFDEIRSHSDDYFVEVFCKERLNEGRFPYPHFNKPKGKLSEVIYENLGWWPAFDKLFKEGDFDLIHAHFGTGAVYALPYVKKHDIPFVVTFHGNDVAALMGTQKYHYSRWRYYLKSKQIFEEADMLLAASEELKALLIELGAHEKKVKVYRLGIDLEKFNYTDPDTAKDKVTFVMVGRFTEKKGHIYTLKALKKVLEEGLYAELTLVGSGKLEADLRAYIDKNGLTKHVHFKGVLSPEEVSEELKKSDVLIAPSIVTFDHDRESGLIVVKEAQATGRPVIGTWHGGIYEIIDDNETGFLLPERNAGILAEKMIKMIKDPELQLKFGKAGRKKMEEEYDLKKQVAILESHYESLITGQQ